MEERIEEGYCGEFQEPEIDKKIKELMEEQKKTCICQVIGKKSGTGFFCKIPYNYETILTLITNYHIIDDEFLENNEFIEIVINKSIAKKFRIDENRKIYSSKNYEYDIMIIKLYETDGINNYLELDKNLFNENSEILYKADYIYILHFPKGGNSIISYGFGIEKINEFDIRHKCNTESCSSGSPILNLSTNKVIGIHKAFIKKGGKDFNIGTLLKYPLSELNNLIMNKNQQESNKLGTDLLSSNFIINYTNTIKPSYANALAVIICLASARVHGRKKLDYFDVREKIINKFGNISNIYQVMENCLSNYKLHFNEVDEKGARKAIKDSRPCLAEFYLTGRQWDNFIEFYNHNKKGILTKEILNENNAFNNKSKGGGNIEVILTHVSEDCLTFLNSWGTFFADNGYFRVKNADVLDVKFFDVFWYITDLSKEEIDAYNNYNKQKP